VSEYLELLQELEASLENSAEILDTLIWSKRRPGVDEDHALVAAREKLHDVQGTVEDAISEEKR
jgi:hypothetical protein